MSVFDCYVHYFGYIYFPDNVSEEMRKEIFDNVDKYLYSKDGYRWRQLVNEDSLREDNTLLFRERPEGVCLDVSSDVQDNPENYLYSMNNGVTWLPVVPRGEKGQNKDTTWIYHGKHPNMWFKKCEIKTNRMKMREMFPKVDFINLCPGDVLGKVKDSCDYSDCCDCVSSWLDSEYKGNITYGD